MYFKKHGIVILGVAFSCLLALSAARAQSFSFSQESSGAYLGISMENVTADNLSRYGLAAEKGVIVRSVNKGSPAEAASLKEDDVILEFAGQPVWSSYQLSRLVKETPPGRKVELGISRSGKRISLTATLQARDSRSNEDILGRLGQLSSRSFDLRRPDTQGDRIAPYRSERSDRSGRSENKPRLGIELQELTEQMSEYLGVSDKKGVLVVSVLSDSASDGKLKAGDVIVGIDNREITRSEELTRFIREASAGEITVKIIRNKRPVSVVINLPSDGSEKGYKL